MPVLTNEQVSDVINDILMQEGGFVDDPNDPGGATNFGITQATADEYGLGPVQNLMTNQAIKFYSIWFANLKIDQIPDFHTFALVADCCVNHGPGNGVFWLQHAIATPADGVIGPNTIAAMGKVPSWQAVYAAILAYRIQFYGHDITRNPSQAKFADGWMIRAASFLSPWPQWGA
jgi:lysozyme family protein